MGKMSHQYFWSVFPEVRLFVFFILFYFLFYTFIQKGQIKLIKKVTVKTFIMLQNNYISNKCCCFELSIHQINLFLSGGTKTHF